MSKSIKKSILAAVALFAGCAFVTTQASAQSTPIPKENSHAGHDHGEAAPVTEILEGTFTELEGDHVIGSAKAPSTMIIYASVTCPHCAHWFETVWPDIKENYVKKDKLRVIFREFPTQPAQLAFAGFLIANCVPEDQYFNNIELQMSEQANLMHSIKLGVVKEAYLDLAKQSGLADEAAMNACLSDADEIARIEKSLALARSGQIMSVPNFIIDGVKYDGKSELVPLRAHLDTLADGGSTPLP